MEYPTTREEAKKTGSKYYFTGQPCKHGHIALRKTKGSCVDCLKVEWAKGNETRAEYFRQYNKQEEVKDRKNDWYLKNRNQVIARASTRPAEQLREYRNTWKENNPELVKANINDRRRRHKNASPRWLSKEQKEAIRQFYKDALTTTRITGKQYVVDHIVPLRSEVVCGLHAPWNLRVITQEENLAKSNKI